MNIKVAGLKDKELAEKQKEELNDLKSNIEVLEAENSTLKASIHQGGIKISSLEQEIHTLEDKYAVQQKQISSQHKHETSAISDYNKTVEQLSD